MSYLYIFIPYFRCDKKLWILFYLFIGLLQLPLRAHFRVQIYMRKMWNSSISFGKMTRVNISYGRFFDACYAQRCKIKFKPSKLTSIFQPKYKSSWPRIFHGIFPGKRLFALWPNAYFIPARAFPAKSEIRTTLLRLRAFFSFRVYFLY